VQEELLHETMLIFGSGNGSPMATNVVVVVVVVVIRVVAIAFSM